MEQTDTVAILADVRQSIDRLSDTAAWLASLPAIAPAPLSTDSLIELVPISLDSDRRHDCIVALLEQLPATVEDARTIIRRIGWVHERARHAAKRRTLPIEGELAAEQPFAKRLGDMYSVIDTLPDADRTILTLAYVESLSDTEIAASLGVSVRTVYRRKASALNAAKKAARVMFPGRSGTE